MGFNMKKNQLGNYGPDDLSCWNNKEKVLNAYKKYAGKPVTIYYNPDDIQEFYVKEMEEEAMLEKFKDNLYIKNYFHTMVVYFKFLLIVFIIIFIGYFANQYISERIFSSLF